MSVLANGFGDLVGDALLGARPIQLSGNVWWVHSGTGADAAGTRGQNRERPLATLLQAITNASAGDVIILKNGHAEVMTANVAISKTLTIVGAGTTSGKPSVTIGSNTGGVNTLTASADGVEVRNVYFTTNVAVENAASRLTAAGNRCRIIGCYFDCGANDRAPAVTLAGATSGHEIVNTTFISTGTLLTAQPESGLATGAGAVTDLILDGCIFSDGTVGFSDDVAVNNSSGAMTNLKATNISLLLGASFGTNWTGYLNVQTVTGGGRS